MTTIAYRDGVLAADSLKTSNGQRYGHATKVRKIGRLLAAISGSAATGESFFDWVRNGIEGDSPYNGNEDGNGIVVMPHAGRLVCWGKRGPEEYRVPYFAMGSGGEVALGAMMIGATAEQAVAVAIKVDIGSGPPVVAVRL